MVFGYKNVQLSVGTNGEAGFQADWVSGLGI